MPSKTSKKRPAATDSRPTTSQAHRQQPTPSGRSAFSKPASKPSPGSANWNAPSHWRFHPPGHQPPVALTSKFLVPGGIEWRVFGDQVDRENFRTRPQPAGQPLATTVIRAAGALLGFNRSMQHTRNCVSRRSVANEAKTEDLLHGKSESHHVGSLAERRISPADRPVV